MNFKTTLIGGAAVGVVLSVAASGGAQAKTIRHHARHGGPTASERALQSEVKDLKSEVQSLEGRLDAQAQAQQQASAQQAAQIAAAADAAHAAQSTATAAATQVASEQSQIETIPAQVEEKTKKFEPLLSGWFENTKIGGTIFADLSYIDNRNDGVRNSQSGTDYDIKRAYITIDHKFNDMFSANITTDFTYDSTTKATQLYIKKAYLQANLFGPALFVRAGSADMPWVPFVESVYGYRFAERVLTDLNGFGTSADWGVHFGGSVLDHHVNYALSVVDGEGYKVPAIGTANRTDAMDVEGRISGTFDNFVVGVGGYDGKLGHDITNTLPTAFNTAERFDALAAYTGPLFHVGFEYLWAKFWNDVTQSNPAKTNTSEGYSVFASVNITKQFSIFGRYDWLKPQEDTNNALVSHYYNVGVDYKPIAPLDLALVYKHDSVDNGLLSTQNGTIGTLMANPQGHGGEYDEVGVFMQWKY